MQWPSMVCDAHHNLFPIRSLTIALEYGEMHLWGANGSGQLGFETEDGFQPVPRHLPFGLPIVDAAGGKSHTVIIDQAGRVHSWGSRAWAQLGHNSQTA